MSLGDVDCDDDVEEDGAVAVGSTKKVQKMNWSSFILMLCRRSGSLLPSLLPSLVSPLSHLLDISLGRDFVVLGARFCLPPFREQVRLSHDSERSVPKRSNLEALCVRCTLVVIFNGLLFRPLCSNGCPAPPPLPFRNIYLNT